MGTTSDGVYFHVHAPASTGYVAQVRDKGYRKWRTVGEYADKKLAAQAMLAGFLDGKSVKRGRVIACFEWYEPSLCMEIVK